MEVQAGESKPSTTGLMGQNISKFGGRKFEIGTDLDFEKLLSNSIGIKKPGDLVEGTVVKIARDHIVIDIGFKSEGHVPISQFLDHEGKVTVIEGDTLDVLIVSPENDQGEVILSKEKADQLKTWTRLEKAFDTGDIVEGKVIQKVKGGLHVDVGVPAFLPGSQVDIRPQRNLDKFLDERMTFKILKLSRERGNIVLSRRTVLEAERTALKRDTINQLSIGVVMEGVVKNVTDYGAFVDLGGIDGLLHITDMSWGRVNHPSEVVTVGQVIPVVVLKYDDGSERVSLGMKQLQKNPWESVGEKYNVGSNVKGKVVSLTDYGAFIRLEEGIEGLIHVSEMTWSRKVQHPSKLVNIGDELEAVVLDFSAEHQRMSLGLKQLTDNPWEQLAREFPIGSKVKGKVRSVTDFGIFINVKDEIDGLVHVSDFSWTKRIKDPKDIRDMFKKGDEIEAVVLEIDADNERLSLGVKQLTPDIWESVPLRYPSGAQVKGVISSVTDFGVFVEIEEGVEGLVHISQLGLAKSEAPKDKYQVGTELDAEVVNIDKADRRISLSLKQGRRTKPKEEYAQYLEESGSSLTFGDLLQQEIKKGK